MKIELEKIFNYTGRSMLNPMWDSVLDTVDICVIDSVWEPVREQMKRSVWDIIWRPVNNHISNKDIV